MVLVRSCWLGNLARLSRCTVEIRTPERDRRRGYFGVRPSWQVVELTNEALVDMTALAATGVKWVLVTRSMLKKGQV